MGIIQKHTCDLCELDGDEGVEAVAFYTAEDNEDYDVCEKHLKDVKAVKLDFKKY